MKKILLLGLMTSVVVYIMLLVMFFGINRSAGKSFNLVEIYISEIERMSALELSLRKIDSDIRSYLLSGNRESIADLQEDYAYVDSCIKFIAGFVSTEPVQAARIKELQRLIQRRRDLSGMAIQRFERGELEIDNIIRLTRSQAGMTEDMRAVLTEMVQDERQHLQEEKANLNRLKMQTYSLAAATGFFPLVIAFFTIYLLTGIIKERDKMGRKLNKLLANKDRFLAIIGHDLKGPAGAIKLMAQVLVEQGDKLGAEKEAIMKKRLLNASANQLKLLEDLVTWAKTQTHTMEFHPRVIDLRAVTEEAILRITEMAISKNITISHTCSASVLVYADEQMIQTVMRNLLQNAVKFTPRNGTVSIKCRIIDDMVELSVSDTGVGMPADKVNMLFLPGSEVSTKGTEGEPGTGLGLILCKEFIDIHGGRIWVESIKGQGSVFYFTLPLPY